MKPLAVSIPTQTPTVVVTAARVAPTPAASSDLPAAVERFRRALEVQDFAALALSFTPQGLGAAMKLQSEFDPAAMTGTTISVGPATTEGPDVLIDLRFVGPTGSATMKTRWDASSGRWGISEISVVR